MPEPTTLRLAQAQDAQAIARLITVLAADLGEPSGVTPAYVAEVIQAGSCRALVAERGGRTLGVLTFYFQPSLYHGASSCVIDELVVEPDGRNQGVGARLLVEAVRLAQEQGCAEISLSAATSNHAALRFYQRHGFEAEAWYLERHFSAG